MTVEFGPDISYFLWSLAAGFVLAVVYDLIRVPRRLVKIPDIIVNVSDILFIIFSGIMMMCGAYAVNNGNFRIYSIFSIVGMFILYRVIMGDRAVNFIADLFRGVKMLIYRVIWRPLKAVAGTVNRTGKRFSRIFSIKKHS